MKNLLKPYQTFKLLLIMMFMLLTACLAYGQKIKPSDSGYASVNGIKVYYEVYGEGRPVVLLHGAFMTIDMNWGQLIPELSKNHKVIAVELQGHGHTPFSDRKLSHSTLAGDVAGVMDHLKIERADIVGYSFGGAIAYEFAIRNPKRLNNLVIISATYKSSGWLPEVRNAFKAMKPALFEKSPMHDAYDAVAPDKSKWTPFLEQMIASAGTPYDMGDSNISKITAPVLIIAGDNDGLDKAELIKTYRLLGGDQSGDLSSMPKSQLAVVPGQGHVSLMMQTATILNYLNSFLK
ncbi:alpha/beta fold hydrolase [Chryseobacterium pennipullorum]|uniref:Alpha/beta hydrolase n=1 Tax=Chryseobacterium pennipullorum TaxID=2258963 RepID=A0A3D9B1K9_9FLAO|nr:alpha/beta hydrolase [Chryseobacterium pennipullorum]REC47511.1 alpha/beta hydrolase [Chryseobacterium pennipullorum]